MIRVVCIDNNGFPRDLGIQDGTVESVREILEEKGFKILSIQESVRED